MLRKIIEIDEERCTGCGICADACHEGAIEMVDGVARLMRDDYCDGFGDCLPECPTGAIRFVEREAAAYDELAVQENKRAKQAQAGGHAHAGGSCPSAAQRSFVRSRHDAPAGEASRPARSQLANWPVQIKLAPAQAPYFEGADLLVAADCCAYAYAAFHPEFMQGRICLIGCPKLDMVDYTEKLSQVLASNDIRSVTVTRMEVPCCGGLERAALDAIEASGKRLPRQVVTFSLDGRVLS